MSVVPLAHASSIDVYQFNTDEEETRYRALIDELRCPKCQNQNLAGSDAPIAQDLKQKTYEMIKDGRSDGEIRQYMFDRYGDFISYKPPVRPSTWILWFFPPLLLVVLILGWVLKAKRGRKPAPAMPHSDNLSRSEEAKLEQILSHHQSTKDQS
ncbi:cytochrome C biogenesis protein [Moraxella caviae]|nr:cytochrome c-type biogenesis protein [Moraxella caviae]OOR91112.1 cytochrome C biogenesis protein [Moraxella caviae]